MTPRVVQLDLARLGREPLALAPRAFRDPDPALERVAALGGAATGLAWLLGALRAARGRPVPLVLAVGEGVRAGLPTAARATVLSRAPLGGFLAEGQVGGDLGPRLAALTDVLVLDGRAPEGLDVLVLDGEGASLEAWPELRGLDPGTVHRRLVERHPGAATLRIGPGGEAGLPFASLASGDEASSFVGRGGLGAVLGGLGLKAVVVRAPAGEPEPDRARSAELVAALLRSPRLESRSRGGTLELFPALAAGGELRARGESRALDVEEGEELYREALALRRERKGCRGCPTPCGWTFAREGERDQRAHFGASQALGPNLGLARFEDSLQLLRDCDAAGLDAKEVGEGLALLARAREEGLLPGPALFGDLSALRGALEDLVRERPGGEPLRGGAVALARRLGQEGRLPSVRGQAVRPAQDRVALFGQCVTAGGTDPMRSFPFLVEAGGRGRLARWSDVPLDPADERPGVDAFLVLWHESLVAGLDVVGFCAFSAAGLLADGVVGPEELARWVVPASWASVDAGEGDVTAAERLLAAGASTVLVRRELEALFGGADAAERPPWLRADPWLSEALATYRALRGLDAGGRPEPETWSEAGTVAVWRRIAQRAREALVSGPAPTEREVPRVAGRVALRAVGPLAEALGGRREVCLPLPASLADVLAAVVSEEAGLGARLIRDGEPVPGAFREGRRLGPRDAVRDGDELLLVSAIRGG